MSYVKQTWVNDVTEVDADHMNHIEDGIDQSYNVELLAVVDTAPSECSEGDKYYNTTTNKIYTATGSNTWGSDGEDAVVGIMYVVFDEQATYSYDGTTMVSVGGGSDEVAISTTQPTNDEKIWINSSMTTNQVKYKDGNTWKEVTIKALDSMPIGTIVEYDGQASDIPSGWQSVTGGKIKKISETTPTMASIVDAYSTSTQDGYSANYVNGELNKLKAYSLYNNTSGATGDIVLSDSVSNYEYIEIFYKNVDSIFASTKVKSPNGKTIGLSCPVTFTGGSGNRGLYAMHSRIIDISGTNINTHTTTSNGSYYGAIALWENGTATLDKTNYIYITQVIGYK